MTIIDCENRFKEISGIDIDLTKDLIKKQILMFNRQKPTNRSLMNLVKYLRHYT